MPEASANMVSSDSSCKYRDSITIYSFNIYSGRRCKHKHVKKVLCEAYMIGFCPDGPNCKFGQYPCCLRLLFCSFLYQLSSSIPLLFAMIHQLSSFTLPKSKV